MTKKEKAAAMKARALGYWSALGGVEWKFTDHAIEDYMTVVVNAWGGKKEAHRVKINYDRNGDRPYIRVCGTRLYLDEGIRC